MRIKDIHVDGFGVWSGLSVNSLPDGMAVFYGRNEAGKTTLMQLTRAVLYGFTPERRRRYLPPVHGGSPGGALRVTGPGGGYQVRRRAELTDSGVQGQLSVMSSDGTAQGQHRLSVLLGQVDEAIFTNVFAIGLRELQELSTLDDTSAADELYKLSSGLDRVSLVDVMRSLRKARERLVGEDPDDPADGRVAELLVARDKLRDEIDELARRGRRWADLAAQRRTQTSEIDELRQRLEGWEHEARCVELALGVRPNWDRRARLQREIRQLAEGLELPDEAPSQMVAFETQLAERKAKLEEVKARRRGLREEADRLPVSRRLLELQPRIEAAAEQAPWLQEIQEQIERLDEQIDAARRQLDEDAERLGIEEEERLGLADGGRTGLPDLSRQTLAALGDPARRVREQAFRLKQAREAGAEDKKEADKLADQLHAALGHASTDDLHDSIRRQGELIGTFRRRIEIEEHAEKLQRHQRDLEREAVELTTAQALPVDRTILLAAPFFAGGVTTAYGFFHLVGWFVERPDPAWGTLVSLCGLALLGFYYLGRQLADQNTGTDLEDCERQLESVRKQVREVEHQRQETDAQLPSGSGTLESRLRAAEEKLVELEGMLPTFHGHQAALQRYRTSRTRASAAAADLKHARGQWRRTLQSLGLSESLSPGSIRQMSDGYEAVLASRRRLESLRGERDQRRRELAALGQKIDALHRQAMLPEEDNPDEAPDAKPRAAAARGQRPSPIDQLTELTDELTRQRHWIDRRRELKQQDDGLKKSHQQLARAVEKIEQNRRSLLIRCGVEIEEQFAELVDRKAQLNTLQTQYDEADREIRAAIGKQVPYDDVARELDAGKGEELERRWEALGNKIQQAEERVAQLQTRQGELAQEMRTLGGDTRLAEAQLELQSIEHQLADCVRHWQVLATTSRLLEEVCQTFEKERQPETLREASGFLRQLTEDKYERIWTPLGTNALKVDNHNGESLPLEVLSRGTREAVFIALRLALASAYARRGVALPLVLDDVLVNFDRDRALAAARTLKQFTELGNQVLMFTCHEHIVQMFHEIEIEVRELPPQGAPGEAVVLPPPALEEMTWQEEAVSDDEAELDDETDERADEVDELQVDELEDEESLDETAAIDAEAEDAVASGAEDAEEEEEPAEEPAAGEETEADEDEPVEHPAAAQAPPQPPEPVEDAHRALRMPPRDAEPQPVLDWLWYEEEPPAEGWFESAEPEEAPPEVFEPPTRWWRGEAVSR